MTREDLLALLLHEPEEFDAMALECPPWLQALHQLFSEAPEAVDSALLYDHHRGDDQHGDDQHGVAGFLQIVQPLLADRWPTLAGRNFNVYPA
ncbi:MAG: hypothetical protein R2932_06720 [Caldilineaceae bacterium]